MEDLFLNNNIDISLISKETEANSSNNASFENQISISSNLKNHIINAIVSNLKDIIKENQKNNKNKLIFKDNIFYLEDLPPISLEKFIQHLVKFTQMDISTLILAVIYMDEFCEKFKYILTLNNIYRLILISVFIGLKYNEDTYVNEKSYASIAGVSVEDLKYLEFQMCVALDFSFFVKSELYQQYFMYFCKFSA
jgi:hypothetical protein